MKDCEGKRIALGSALEVVNDGDIVKVEKLCDVCPILGIRDNDIFIPLRDFETDDNGNLIDFKRK